MNLVNPGSPDPSEPNPRLLQRAILSALHNVQGDGFEYRYLPAIFTLALEPDVLVVTGIRGSGKSQLVRKLAAQGGAWRLFDPGAPPDRGPRKDELQRLLAQGQPPRLIWKTILLARVARALGDASAEALSVDWVKEHPREADRVLLEFDRFHKASQTTALLLFDDFEQMADTLRDRVRLLRGVLELMLELRPLPSLRLKAFVHPDLLSQPGATAFAGGARVLSSQGVLLWQTQDLYALLYAHLGNAGDLEAAQHFRQVSGLHWPESGGGFRLPEGLSQDLARQRKLLHVLSGGGGGIVEPFSHLTEGLADSHGRISPQSFLWAVLNAAVWAQHRNRGEFPLSLSCRIGGLVEAARLCAQWLNEELPWAHRALKLLDGLAVPIDEAEVIDAWETAGFIPPKAEEEGREPTEADAFDALDQLQQVGAILVLADERIEVPEVYRLGFGLGRRGGFRPA